MKPQYLIALVSLVASSLPTLVNACSLPLYVITGSASSRMGLAAQLLLMAALEGVSHIKENQDEGGD